MGRGGGADTRRGQTETREEIKEEKTHEVRPHTHKLPLAGGIRASSGKACHEVHDAAEDPCTVQLRRDSELLQHVPVQHWHNVAADLAC